MRNLFLIIPQSYHNTVCRSPAWQVAPCTVPADWRTTTVFFQPSSTCRFRCWKRRWYCRRWLFAVFLQPPCWLASAPFPLPRSELQQNGKRLVQNPEQNAYSNIKAFRNLVNSPERVEQRRQRITRYHSTGE